jgi:hypothetical protein
VTHSMPKPNLAPACEYVAIPLGSSSEAPVMRPGPSSRNRRLSFDRCSELAGCSESVRFDAASAPGTVAMPGTSLQRVAELRTSFGGTADAGEFPGERCERMRAERDGQQRRPTGEDMEDHLVQAIADGADSRAENSRTNDRMLCNRLCSTHDAPPFWRIRLLIPSRRHVR